MHLLHCLTPPFNSCYSGALLVSLSPSLRVICCVAASDLPPNGELTALACADLWNYLQLTLRMEVRDRGVIPDPDMLNLLQVSQETDISQL